MDLGNFNLNQDKPNNFISNFMNSLLNSLQNKNQNINNSIHLENNCIYVVRDYQDNKLSLVNISNGKEYDVSVCFNKNELTSNFYEISRSDFYNLDLGSNLIFKDGKLSTYNDEIELSASAASKLEDMYFSIEQDKNSTFIVDKITDEKIILTYSDGSGFFSIYKEVYPDLKIGDNLKKENGKYVKI